jgi:IS30 family transposase
MDAMSAEAEEPEETEDNPLDDEEYLREQYHEEEKTQSEIGDEHGVTSSTVSHYMKKHSVETRGSGSVDERANDPEWLEEKYVDEEMTMQEIADELNCSDGTIMRRLHDFDIEVRRSTSNDEEEEEAEEEAEEAEDEEETEEEADEE